ncbi:hypothetical protein V6N13_021222 [Hibiscus sabdariffa]
MSTGVFLLFQICHAMEVNRMFYGQFELSSASGATTFSPEECVRVSLYCVCKLGMRHLALIRNSIYYDWREVDLGKQAI